MSRLRRTSTCSSASRRITPARRSVKADAGREADQAARVPERGLRRGLHSQSLLGVKSFMVEPAWNAARVKERARELGADLVGTASAAMLNAFPPDPRWPQTPERISPYCRSVIVLVQRIPAGAFRCKTNTPVQYIDMLVLRKMDKVAYRVAAGVEEGGAPQFVAAAAQK